MSIPSGGRTASSSIDRVRRRSFSKLDEGRPASDKPDGPISRRTTARPDHVLDPGAALEVLASCLRGRDRGARGSRLRRQFRLRRTCSRIRGRPPSNNQGSGCGDQLDLGRTRSDARAGAMDNPADRADQPDRDDPDWTDHPERTSHGRGRSARLGEVRPDARPSTRPASRTVDGVDPASRFSVPATFHAPRTRGIAVLRSAVRPSLGRSGHELFEGWPDWRGEQQFPGRSDNRPDQFGPRHQILIWSSRSWPNCWRTFWRDQIDQLEDVGRPRPRLGDDEVGVAVGNLGPADPLPLQARPLDQGPGRELGARGS